MDKLGKKALKEIRWILEGIRDGKLKHEQGSIHCGSAHCLCGWKATLDYARAKKKAIASIIPVDVDETTVRGNGSVAWAISKFCTTNLAMVGYRGWPEWKYAQDKWGLTTAEADMMFDGGNTLTQMFIQLELLEQGYRAEYSNEWVHYETGERKMEERD